jgi:hypothetical protein
MFLVLTGIMLVGLKIGAISALATSVAPRLSIVTNCLDTISLILLTPKLFTIEARDNVRDLSIQMPRSFTFNKITIPRNILTPIFRAAMFLLLLLRLKYLGDYNASQLLVICETLNKIFANPFCDYISKHVIENQIVSAKMWSSFGGPVMFVCGVVVTSVTLLRLLRAIAKSQEAQEKLNDMALILGLVVFVYSRALSMMG